MHEPEKLDKLLEQLARVDVQPPAALQQAVLNRIRRRHIFVQWTVILSLVLNTFLFVSLLAAPWIPGLSPLDRVVIWVVESLITSAVIATLLAVRDRIGKALSRLELLVFTKQSYGGTHGTS